MASDRYNGRMNRPSFKDHFSGIAGDYAAFRPRYPAALFDYLAGLAPGRTLAWDCACGSGQATMELASRFEAVVATDASSRQIAAALALPNVLYRVATAEASGLAEASVNLVTVAQALHWFDVDCFYAEVHRVLVPDGVLAVWTYEVQQVDGETIDALLKHFYRITVGPHWPPERRLVEEGYRTLPFPFAELRSPGFEMAVSWSLPQLLGYFRSWSATSRYIAAEGRDPVTALMDELLPLWGEPASPRRISWPLSLRVGRKTR